MVNGEKKIQQLNEITKKTVKKYERFVNIIMKKRSDSERI